MWVHLIKVPPGTRDGEFAPTVFERYQRNEKALLASMLEMYVSGVSTRKVSKIVEELCGKSVSKSFVSSLTEQLDPMVNEWQNRSLSGTNYPYPDDGCSLHKSPRRPSSAF